MDSLEELRYIDRKTVAQILNVSIHTLEIWKNLDRHKLLHRNFFKLRGRICHYKLSDVEQFLKEWDPPRYHEYNTEKNNNST
jgi:hypothetical protein